MEHHVHQYQHNGDLTTHLVDGHAVSTSIDSLFGKTFLDHIGNPFAHTQPNALGGKDAFHDGNLVSKTVATKLGYHDLLSGYDLQVMKHGPTTIGIHGGNVVYTANDLGHGFVDVMSNADPLMHVGQYSMPTFRF